MGDGRAQGGDDWGAVGSLDHSGEHLAEVVLVGQKSLTVKREHQIAILLKIRK